MLHALGCRFCGAASGAPHATQCGSLAAQLPAVINLVHDNASRNTVRISGAQLRTVINLRQRSILLHNENNVSGFILVKRYQESVNWRLMCRSRPLRLATADAIEARRCVMRWCLASWKHWYLCRRCCPAFWKALVFMQEMLPGLHESTRACAGDAAWPLWKHACLCKKCCLDSLEALVCMQQMA